MNIEILEAPIDLGASRHGSDMGPSSLHLAGLEQKLQSLNHCVVCEHNVCKDVFLLEDLRDAGNVHAKYLTPITKACENLAKYVHNACVAGNFPLVLGGDHSVALGSIAGTSAWARDNGKKLGVLYVDAHGDFNTADISITGNIHGQCLSASCGFGLPQLTNLYYDGCKVDPKNVCLVGVRDLDPQEKVLMKKAGVKVFSMSDIDRLGFHTVVGKVIDFFKTNVDLLHVSFDMDALDPMFAPGTGIQVSAGLNNREALLLMEEISNTNIVKSAEFVEVNPVLDVRSTTALLCVNLIARLLGEHIY